MADGQRRDADESWTDVDGSRAEPIETTPIRYGTVLGGRYAVDKIIGRGGCGLVVRAHDRDLRVSVAIKIVRAELAGERVWTDRLAREVKLARQIQHPHVCRVFDFEQADGRAFLVMELAERGSLRDEMRAETAGARPWAERIADARAVVSALAAIHGAGIVHRDLTPQNLLRMADGRLVLSDFGLATDAGATTTNIHGGTISYMAPELLRGGRATIASDIWALGVVMHEIVFGARPRWRDGASSEMLPPALGRKLTRAERAVFETCRACTATEARRRIAGAAEAGRRLTEGGGWRARWLGAPRRPTIAAVALTVAAAIGVGAWWTRQKRTAAPASAEEEAPLIIPTGEPTDWTYKSIVLAEVPERITCTRLLPDKRTIRFVWGTPPRAEDIDTVTRKRSPSPVVPSAYAEGCPDLSSDGKRLLFQGHTKEGSAYAFLSETPDGKDAVPVVQTAEPTMSSEPTWLPDGQTFSFDVDSKHMGVFFVRSGHMSVLPGPTTEPFLTAFHHVVGNLVYVSVTKADTGADVVGISLPALRQETRFRLPVFALDLRSDGRFVYFVNPVWGRKVDLVQTDLSTRKARRVGYIRDQVFRHPTFAGEGMTFASIRQDSYLAVRQADGRLSRLPRGDRILHASHCGSDIVVCRELDGRSVIEVLDSKGRLQRAVTRGPADSTPVCSPDGRVVFYVQGFPTWTVRRCDASECRDLRPLKASYLSMSPDGKRLAIMSFENRGPIVSWIAVEGGELHEVGESETACRPGWASADTLWISRARNGKTIWTEVDAASGREIGKILPGARECSDGWSDPASPVDPDLRIVYDQTSQLRLLPREYLEHE